MKSEKISGTLRERIYCGQAHLHIAGVNKVISNEFAMWGS